MTIRGGGDPLFTMAFKAAIKDGPAVPEFAADARDCIMVRSLKDRPNTRLRRDERLIAGSPRISSPANAAVHLTSRSRLRRRQTACEDDHA